MFKYFIYHFIYTPDVLRSCVSTAKPNQYRHLFFQNVKNFNKPSINLDVKPY